MDETKRQRRKEGEVPDKGTSKGCSRENYRRKSYDKNSSRNNDRDGKPKNDYMWYAVSEQIGKDAASIPFNVFSGTKITNLAGQPVGAVVPADATCGSVPSVVTLNYITTPGVSDNPNSAVNVAARAIYSWVRHQNSGSKNYEAVDLMMYILAMSSIYCHILEAKRIYKAAVTYSYLNRAIPDALLTAMQVNSDDVRSHLAQFRAGINLRIAKLSSLCVPQAYDVFKRQAVIASYVYADSDSERGQYYLFKRSGYWVFNATAETGGQLDYKPIVTIRKHTDILEQIDEALDVLLADEDINTMSGDILKAYGRDSLYAIPELKDNEPLEFVFDEDILNQIENSTCVASQGTASVVPSISQQNGYLKFIPTFTQNGNAIDDEAVMLQSGGLYFNSHKKEPDWKDILEWSRMMTVIDINSKTGEATKTYNMACGTELLSSYTLVCYDADSASYVTTTFTNFIVLNGDSIDVSAGQVLNILTEMSKFDWHPAFYTFYNKAAGAGNSFNGCAMDLKVYTRVDTEIVKRLHDTAVMGEFKTQLIVSK